MEDHVGEGLVGLNRIIDAQAAEVERLSREVSLMRTGLSFRLGHSLVHGLRSREGARHMASSLRGIGRDAKAKLREERMGTTHPGGMPNRLASPRRGPSSLELRMRTIRTGSLTVRASKDYVVAIICDEFTYNSFQPEFTLVPLSPDNWREQMDRHSPDLLFVESAWSGIDSAARPWKGKIYASDRFPRENRTALLAVLAYCRRRGIPTSFWNKEDPTHFSDRHHDFVATAALFDHVFTTDEECVDGYRDTHGIKATVLPFGTQPRLFNPFDAPQRSNDVVFAGSWYENHVERSHIMAQMFDAVLAQGFALKIYDRYLGSDDPLHRFPARFRPYLHSPVPHDQIASVYRESAFGMNINTVVDSPTMFARRVFELASSNTLILTNYSRGVAEFFGDSVLFLDRNPGALKDLSREDGDRLRERALTKVLRHHTYAHRATAILSALGLPHRPPEPTLTTVTTVDATEQIPDVVQQFQHSRRRGDKLLLCLATAMEPLHVARAYREFMSHDVSVVSLRYVPRIETTHFALCDSDHLPSRSRVEDVMLHAPYMDDKWLTLDRRGKLTQWDTTEIRNVVGPAHRIEDALRQQGGIVDEVSFSV